MSDPLDLDAIERRATYAAGAAETLAALSGRRMLDGHDATAHDPTAWYGGWGVRAFPVADALARHKVPDLVADVRALVVEVRRLRAWLALGGLAVPVGWPEVDQAPKGGAA